MTTDTDRAATLVAELLEERGCATTRPPRDGCLTITYPGALHNQLSVDERGGGTWSYRPVRHDPAALVPVVSRMLAADVAGPQPEDGAFRRAVARALTDRGLRVELEVYPDEVDYDVVSELAVRNPDRPDRGVVYVADNGLLQWYVEPIDTGRVLPDELAETVADALLAPVHASV